MLLESQPETQVEEETHEERVARATAEIYAKRAVRRKAASEYNKKWRAENRDYLCAYKRRRYHRLKATDPGFMDRLRAKDLMKNLGITPEQKRELFRLQGDRCGVCRTETPGKMGWHTDHDHKTGKVRGVLCGPCNQALGLLKDDTVRLQTAIEYLERTRG